MHAPSRRQFLADVSRVGFLTWLAAEAGLDALATPAAPDSTSGGILELHLQSADPEELVGFYRDTMGWKVSRDGVELIVHSGGTRIIFGPSFEHQSATYHVAWAIPSNKFEMAKVWLSTRTPLLIAPDGRDEFHFRSIPRRAVYFSDPAGNVLELIARDELGDRRRGSFDLEDILYVNHVGLVVDDMDRAIARLHADLDLQPTQPPLPTFTKLGDSHRHVVLVPRGRRWLPEDKLPADIFPTEVVLDGRGKARCDFEDLPYSVGIRG